MFKNRPKTLWNARTISILGMMIALTIVLTRVLSINIGPTIRLSLGNVCTVLTGMWFGPLAGALAGGLADVVRLMMAPSGAWLPLITVAAAMWGVIPGFLTGMITGSRKRRYVMICCVVLITSLVCQMGLTTIALVNAYGIGMLPGRIAQFAGSTPIYCVVICLLYSSPVTRMVYVPGFTSRRTLQPASK